MPRFFLFCFCALATFFSQAAAPGLSAAKCFSEAPATVLPLLQNSTRLDMLDYFHAGSQKASKNVAEGDARVTAESDYSIEFQISEGITGQMFVLNPMEKCPLIGLIETVSLPMKDSSVKIYNCRWEPVDVLAMPGIEDWVKSDRKNALPELENTLPFILATCHYDPADAKLIITNTTSDYFASSERPEVLDAMRDKIVLRWTGKKFK